MNIDRAVNLIFDLLDEYDRSLWEGISYIDLAEEWIKIVDKTYKQWEKKENFDLDERRKQLLKDFLLGDSND